MEGKDTRSNGHSEGWYVNYLLMYVLWELGKQGAGSQEKGNRGKEEGLRMAKRLSDCGRVKVEVCRRGGLDKWLKHT